MQASPFDEVACFRAIANSGARVLMIGRRALVALGLPVMTTDYDFWTLADEAEALNAAVRELEMCPNRPPETRLLENLCPTVLVGHQNEEIPDWGRYVNGAE